MFDTIENMDLYRKLGVNLVPFPRLHFFTCSQAPIFAAGSGGYVRLNVQELTEQLWSKQNALASLEGNGRFMASSFIYRSHGMNSDLVVNGYIRKIMNDEYSRLPTDVIDLFHKYSSGFRGCGLTTEEVERELADVQMKWKDDFVEWIPNNIKCTLVGVGPTDTSMSGTMVANTTAMKSVFQRISVQFTKMFRRKAFLHWYKGEGMDSMEFEECDADLRDIITEFQDKQDVVYDLTDDDEEVDGDEEEHDDGDAIAVDDVNNLIEEYDNV